MSQVNKAGEKINGRLIRTNVAAERLDVSRDTVYRLFRSGQLEGERRSPRNIRIFEWSLERYIEQSKENENACKVL